jgi:hypothetical protein
MALVPSKRVLLVEGGATRISSLRQTNPHFGQGRTEIAASETEQSANKARIALEQGRW